MLHLLNRSIARKLMIAVGVPCVLFALAGVLWLRHEARVLGPALEPVHRIGLATLLAFAAAASLAQFVAVRRVVERPLQRLAAGLRRAREDGFLHRIPVLGEDELGQLAREFNATLAAVTDLHARRIEDAASIESMQRELALKAQLEAQHRLLDETNRRLEGRVRELSLLSDLTRTLSSTLELEELLRFMGDLLGRSLGYHAFEILLTDEATGDLVVRSTCGMDESAVGLRLRPGDGPAGWAAERRQHVLVRDTQVDPRRPHHHGQGGAEGSILAIPMIHQDEAIGVLSLFRPAIDAFPDEEVRVLQAAASQAAMAVANARLHQKMVRLSQTDALTGVHNRRSLFARLEMELERSQRFEHRMGVALVDVDHFKRFNEARGHGAGDVVLKRVGSLLRDTTRKVDLVARYGGEEFAVVVPGAGREAALEVGEKLRAAVEKAALPREDGAPVTISVGIAAFPDDARDLASLMDCADAALYAAKRAGRNAVRSFEPGMREHPGRKRNVKITAEAEPAPR
jgi:diguanylate cyclase (GGDEF)-like protein